jgi:hypothetical protein
MRTLEFSGREGPIRLSIHPKRGLAVLRFPEGRETLFEIPVEGVRLAFPNVPCFELGAEWRPLSGVTASPDFPAVLQKVAFPDGQAWFTVTTYHGIWAHAYTKPGQRW